MSIAIHAPGEEKAAQIVEQIKTAGLTGILLSSPENVYYMSGLPTLPGSGNPILFALKNQLPFYVYIGADGKTTLLCWIGATMGFSFSVDDVISFFNYDSALGELHDFLQTTLPAGARLGIESSCPFSVLSSINDVISSNALIVIDDMLLALRLSKTEQELALIRQATTIVEASVSDLRSTLKVGMTRLSLINSAKRLMLEHGATGIGHTTIAFGASNAEIAFDETLEANQLVTLDLGAIVDGYVSDNRRLFYTGTLPDELQALHATMCSIVRQIGQALRPGIAFAELYSMATELYEARSLPPFFISIGHSIGLQTEEVWISPDSPYTVQAGMVLNIELYTPYQDSLNIGDEETFLVMENETLQITKTSPAIQSVLFS